MSSEKNRLGRGLGALIAGSGSVPTKTLPAAKTAPMKGGLLSKGAAAAKGVEQAPAKAEPLADTHNLYLDIPLGKIQANPHQPRRQIHEETLLELAESIRSEGLLQPVVVRRLEGGHFELIAGERRLRACKKIGLRSIPARVLDVSDASSAVLALIENLQREGLDPIEEAAGYATLMHDFKLTQESVAERVGKARASVANALRLLQLDREVQGYISQGLLSSGHAKVLLGVEEAAHRLVLARRILEQGLSVREAEQAVRRIKAESEGAQGANSANRLTALSQQQMAIELEAIQRRLMAHFNTKVQLKHTPRKGRLVIEYYGERDLERIMERLGV